MRVAKVSTFIKFVFRKFVIELIMIKLLHIKLISLYSVHVPLESPTAMNDTCNGISGKLIYNNYIMSSRCAVFEICCVLDVLCSRYAVF